MSLVTLSPSDIAANLVADMAVLERLTYPLPWPPLTILIELHAIVATTMLADLPRAQRAASVAKQIAAHYPNDSLVQAQACWSQGSAILHVPDYAGALAHYDAALDYYEEARVTSAPQEPSRDIRVVHVPRVFCLSELGRYAEAHQAVALAEAWLHEHSHPYAQLTLLLNRSQLSGRIGAYNQMITLADATIALASTLEDWARAGQGWINRAIGCTYLGRYDEAAHALNQGILLSAQAEDFLTVARGQYNRAFLLRCQGQLFAALTTLREAQSGLAIAVNEAGTIALEEAVIGAQLRQLPEALQAAQRAATFFAQHGMQAYSIDAALHAARIALQLQQSHTAQAMIDWARSQSASFPMPLVHAELDLVAASLAILLAQRQERGIRQLRRHYALAQRAISTLHTHGLAFAADEGLLILAALEQYLGYPKRAYQSLSQLLAHPVSHIRLAAYALMSDVLPREAALPYLQQAADLAVAQRRMLPMEELQARYSSETSTYHLRLVWYWLAQGDKEQALMALWAAKAGPFLDLRAVHGEYDAHSQANLQQLKSQLAIARIRVEQLRRQLHEAILQQYDHTQEHTQGLATAEAELASYERQIIDLLRLQGKGAGFALLPTLQQVRDALESTTALLEFAHYDNELISFLIPATGPVQIYRHGSYQALTHVLDRWKLVCHRAMGEEDATRYPNYLDDVIAALYQRLLLPWHSALLGCRNLIIAPTGILNEVPWVALSSPLTKGNSGPIVMVTACAALWTPPPAYHNDSDSPIRLLGYAGSEEQYLPHVAHELHTIQRHFPHATLSTSATMKDIQHSPAPSLLHIAAHGITVASAPLCSTIELADGPFLLLEAHRLNLRGTMLVTLSACETGVRPDYGEMALALAGAFLCAGSAAVLASLWKVSDAATFALMDLFYAAIAAGSSLPEALHQAQQQCRQRFPLDWMAFQLWVGYAIPQ